MRRDDDRQEIRLRKTRTVPRESPTSLVMLQLTFLAALATFFVIVRDLAGAPGAPMAKMFNAPTDAA